jgi:hypothetical protein
MISFIHGGGPQMASYRYRARIPANSLGASINNLEADILIFAKPMPEEISFARDRKNWGAKIIVDFCDDHFEWNSYQEMAALADIVTCSTPVLAEKIPRPCYVIPDTYEFPEKEPHCNGSNLLWFGHSVNYKTICNLDVGLTRIVCNRPGCIPWSIPTMHEEFARADIVLMPKTADYKSPNRTLEAIRQGCFVVAEPHPALMEFPIWIGDDIKEGIEWASQNLQTANEMIREAQDFIKRKYSPAIQAAAWRTVLAALN